MLCLIGRERFWLVLALTFLGCGAAAARAADAAAGKQAYAVCAACHGQQGEGNEALNAPRLAGQASWYLRRQIEDFQKGLRGTRPGDVYGMQMRPMAMSLTGGDAIDNVVAYIETLPDVPAQPTIQGDVAAGQASYGVCASCHGQKGEGLEQMGAPRLAGQSDWYLVRQLKNFQKGERGYDPKDVFGNQMRPMASTLTSDAAITNVVAYINTLR